MKMSYREAMREALRAALLADPRVFLMGEDVGKYGGSYAVSKGFLDEFGPERIRDTPLSELGFVGAGIGAALGGMRPVVEIMTVNFSLLALDQIVNTAAAMRHMSGGQFGVPLVIRMATGAGRQLAAQHSHSLEGWYAHIPGIRVLAPAMTEYFKNKSTRLLDAYSDTCLRRVWKVERFSWSVCSMTHNFPEDTPFDRRMRSATLDYLTSSAASGLTFAENFVGLPLEESLLGDDERDARITMLKDQ